MKLPSLLNVRYMPRWIILLMDGLLAFFSIIFSYLLRFNFQTEQITSNLFIRGIFATAVVYLFVSVYFKTYKGIIRHTTLQDTVKIFYAVLVSHIFIAIINEIIVSTQGLLLVPFSVLVINAFISFCLIAGSRISIKQIFETASNTKKEPIIIFGAGDMGQTALKAILQDKVNPWKVVALIDDNPGKIGKNLAGIPIYDIMHMDKLLQKYAIKRAIIAVNHISINRRNEVASFFIEQGIKVSILPSTQQWLNHSFKIRQLRDIKIEDLLEREPIEINNKEINTTLKGKRVLITGAAGSIGSEIVRQVSRFEPELLILADIAESPLHSIGLELEESVDEIPYKLFICNITDLRRMESLFQNYAPNIVFHAAAYKHVPMMEEHPREAVFNNISGTKVIADLSVKYSVERFVMVSTDKAVNPTNVMGASKRIAEMYIHALYERIRMEIQDGDECRKTIFITTRFGNVLGSNGSVIPRFKAQLEKGGPITVTHPDITRFFMTIPEACQLVLEAGVMGKGGEIFIFDMGKSVRIADLARKIISLAGLKPDEDIKITYTGLRPGEKLFEELLSKIESTLPTYHKKIKIAQVSCNKQNVLELVEDLIFHARKGSDWECVRLMKQMAPEFISNNSKYEKLDQAKKSIDTPIASELLEKASDMNAVSS